MSKKIRVVKDRTHPGMFRVKGPDGELSADFYNVSWAKEHAF